MIATKVRVEVNIWLIFFVMCQNACRVFSLTAILGTIKCSGVLESLTDILSLASGSVEIELFFVFSSGQQKEKVLFSLYNIH